MKMQPWSMLIQDYNILQSQVLPGLQKASSSPEFSEAIENGPERGEAVKRV